MERDSSTCIVGGIAVGAAAMYLLDPRSGRRRRALARDRLVHCLNVAEAALGRLFHDAGNRTQGTVARTRRLLTPEELVDDRRLEARVRSTLGRLTNKPGAITVEAQAGTVILTGRVAESELGYVLTGIRRVRGVRRVESRLRGTERPSPETPAPAATRRLGTPPDLLQHSMSPTSRLIVGTTGFGLLAKGINRGGLPGTASALLGGLLIARAVTNTMPKIAPPPDPPSGVTVERTLEVPVPVREVFRFWSNLQNLPRFMRHLQEVRENESGTSHWVAQGTGGGMVSWDAEITALKPHQRIAWKSLDGSDVITAGDIRFEEVDESTTRIQIQMTYPRGGTKQTPFGAMPDQQIDGDLRQLQELLQGVGSAESAPRAARNEMHLAH